MTPLREPSQVEGAPSALARVLAAALSCGCMCSRICNTLADETMATATSHSALRIFMVFSLSLLPAHSFQFVDTSCSFLTCALHGIARAKR
jgi:hypothetical protein